MDALFSSLATERSGPRGPDDPPCIALGTLYGVLRLGLRLLPEVYAMPTQNMSFLRPIPKASTVPHPCQHYGTHACRALARARVCVVVCVLLNQPGHRAHVLVAAIRRKDRHLWVPCLSPGLTTCVPSWGNGWNHR